MNRNLCQKCQENPVTVNYKRKGKTYYRKHCYRCIEETRNKKNLVASLLKKSGYKLKLYCDRCGFKAKTPKQMSLHYVDKDPMNTSIQNLRSVCKNCDIELREFPRLKCDAPVADF